MGKRIKQTILDSGLVHTRTCGSPQGDLLNFDVELKSSPLSHKKSTKFTLVLESGVRLELDGRKAKTLREVLNRHFDAVE